MRTIGSVLVLLLGFVGAPASHADEVLKVGKSVHDFTDFFASGTVNAHDLTECKRLFLIGVPYADSIPKWMRELEKPVPKQKGTGHSP